MKKGKRLISDIEKRERIEKFRNKIEERKKELEREGVKNPKSFSSI
jgi:hypothetical protein